MIKHNVKNNICHTRVNTYFHVVSTPDCDGFYFVFINQPDGHSFKTYFYQKSNFYTQEILWAVVDLAVVDLFHHHEMFTPYQRPIYHRQYRSGTGAYVN